MAGQNGVEIWYNYFMKSRHPKVTREKFIYKDGGTIHLDWTWSKTCPEGLGLDTPSNDDVPILIIVPGFTNDSSDIYMQNMVIEATTSGWHTVCIGPRGF